MRFSQKAGISKQIVNQVYGVDFHETIQQNEESNQMEAATEFGIVGRQVQQLRKNKNR